MKCLIFKPLSSIINIDLNIKKKNLLGEMS